MLFIIQTTGLVTHTVSKETASTSSAAMAEKEAFVQCLQEAKEIFPHLTTVTTDANSSIRSHMAKKEPNIIHGLDVWHLNKNLIRNLSKNATQKVNKNLN